MSAKGLTRREFLRIAGITGVGAVAAACAPTVAPTSAPSTAPAANSTAAPAAASVVPQPTTGPSYGGILKVAEQLDGVSIGYPPKSPTVTAMRQVRPVIETLFRTNKDGSLAPWLALGEKGDVAAKMITLTLRKGVKFHDGTDFDAEAVKWNLEQHMASKSTGTEKVKSVDLVDDSTVRITLTEWDSTVTPNLTQAMGMVISPSAYQKNGGDWAAKNPVGTGPFQFVSWEKDVRTVYKRFEGYWQKGKPYLDGIEWTPIPDQTTRQMSLRKGDVQVGLSTASKDLKSLENDGLVVTRLMMGSGVRTIIPDSANPQSPWADLRVRQAAQYAIDTSAIVKAVYAGEGEPANQWIYKGHWGYNPSVVGYPYNPTKAKQLLAEAGRANGFKTKYTVLSSSGAPDDLVVAVQGYLKEVGIEVEFDLVQPARFNQIAIGGTWDGLLFGTTWGNPDLAQALALKASGTSWHKQMLIPEDYAKALAHAISAPDFETKQKSVQEVMKLMIDKYCLMICIGAEYKSVVNQSAVRATGLIQTPNEPEWTPEDAWLAKV